MNQDGLSGIRREYGAFSLDDDKVPDDPFLQFERWLTDAIQENMPDPTAMVLSTVDVMGCPDSRVVLLKGVDAETLVFYTYYSSTKAIQIEANPHVAVLFYWPVLARQVRMRGEIAQVSPEQSDAYFYTRPIESQRTAMISRQSKIITNRAQLETARDTFDNSQPILRPVDWGGYAVTPHTIEFFQGRDNRLHDRIQYQLRAGIWHHHRLSP